MLRGIVSVAVPVFLLLGFAPGQDHSAQALILWLSLPLVLAGPAVARAGSDVTSHRKNPQNPFYLGISSRR